MERVNICRVGPSFLRPQQFTLAAANQLLTQILTDGPWLGVSLLLSIPASSALVVPDPTAGSPPGSCWTFFTTAEPLLEAHPK